MASRTLISVEEYLRTSYRPDCDYIDGEVMERNVGELDHGDLQLTIGTYFRVRQQQWGVYAITEVRVQVSPTRFRLPDVCVLLGGRPAEQVLTKPPFLCIEVVSAEDGMSRVRERVKDYLAMGVPNVWVIDPSDRSAHTITPAEGWREVKDGVLRTTAPNLDVPLAELFA